jgi:EmrB/QacA subfamily drug resistance transporter
MEENTRPASNQSGMTLSVRGMPVRPWLAFTALVFGFFMALLDATVVNIALPTIQKSLNTDLSTVSWVLNAYNLVFAVLLVVAGRFADQYGRKRVFMIGMALFAVGSLFCAWAEILSSWTGWSAINWLIAARALQAIGAAGLTPVSLAMIMAIFPADKRGPAIGAWGALAGLASSIGPVLGGFLVQNFAWTSIFYVNLPVSIVGLTLVYLFVPETKMPNVSKRIDLLGVVTLTVALFCLTLGIIQGNDWGWTSLPTLSLFGVALVGLLLFGLVEYLQRYGEPIMDFSLFKAISFSGANVTIFLVGIALQGAFLILALYFMTALGYSQVNTAVALLPMTLGMMVVAILMGRFGRRVNPNMLALIGVVLLGIGLLLLTTLSLETPYWIIALIAAEIGLGCGMIFQSLPALSLSDVPHAKLGVGSGVFNTFRQVGFTLGVAVLISAFTAVITPNINHARDNSIALVQADTTLPAQMKDGIIKGLQQVDASKMQQRGEASSGDSSSQFDLTKLADQLPSTMPAQSKDAIKSDLKSLNDQISHEFKASVADSYKLPWLVAAGFALAGAVAAALAYLIRRASSGGKKEQPANAPDAERDAEQMAAAVGG